MTSAPSPYGAVLGDALRGLHPRLLPYFEAIPTGSTGHGRGTFSVVGTPRRWLWPVLWVLGRQGLLFAVDRRDVPFTVRNTPGVDATGAVTVRAVRTFRFADGHRDMVDAVTATPRGLVDRLGHRGRWLADLSASVDDGALTMRSTRLALRVGRARVPLPRAISPVVSLHESYDESVGRQRVSVLLDLPLVGRMYEYTGHFDYEVVADGPPDLPDLPDGPRPDRRHGHDDDHDHDPDVTPPTRRGPRP